MSRLPVLGSDSNTWGSVLNDFLLVSHNADGTLQVTPVDKATFAAKGDLLAGTGTSAYVRLAVGTDGQVLTADSSQTGGLAWASAGGSSNVITGTQADPTAVSISSTTAGAGTSSAGGTDAVALGYGSQADANDSIAIGLAWAKTPNDIAVGDSAVAGDASHPAGTGATAVGFDTNAFGRDSLAIGSGANADQPATLGASAIGKNTIASGDESTAVGAYAEASGSLANALGSETLAAANYATAVGANTRVNIGATGGVAIGTDSSGAGAAVSASNDFALGTANHQERIPGKLRLDRPLQTTVGAAGAAAILPAQPSAYLPIVASDGTEYVLPVYLKT